MDLIISLISFINYPDSDARKNNKIVVQTFFHSNWAQRNNYMSETPLLIIVQGANYSNFYYY